MKAVVDTNVLAYFLLGTKPFAADSRRLLALLSQPVAPVLMEAEIANVIWMAVRSGVLALEEGVKRLSLSTRLGIELVPIRNLLQGALLLSADTGIAVYDTLFIELAMREGCPMATFDRALIRSFPDIAACPRHFLSGQIGTPKH